MINRIVNLSTRTLLLWLLLASVAHGQSRVPSSCVAGDSVLKLYNDDADRMAIRYAFDQPTAWTDSTTINPAIKDTLLKALMAVYNATVLPARDSVVSMAKIHISSYFSLTDFYVCADTNLLWVKELAQGKLVTGSHKVDSLISRYGMTLEWTSLLSSGSRCFKFKTAANYNLYALTDVFDSLPGVVDASVEHPAGVDKADIEAKMNSGYIELTYSYGWGDCILGCIYRRYWVFRVYPGCEVAYLGSYGDPAPDFMGLEERGNAKITASPNPFNELILIRGEWKRLEYELFNSAGMRIQRGSLQNGEIPVNANLPRGIYHLVLKTERQQPHVHKLLKQ